MTDRTTRDHAYLDSDLGFLLARGSATLSRATNAALVPVGLKVRAYSVLAAVCDEPDGATQRRLATTVGLDPSQIVALVDELEGRGLVVRTVDPADRRNKLISVTAEGIRLADKASRISAQVSAEHFPDVPAKDLATMRRVLRLLGE
ncbi:winged helix-turn-helix transcriptional regulator [Gordonia sp. TBRC 11910]|uniref:Winged helix-turn-helix transcriptional regulator n=1 Tax=Gordonia asplenii TaxID=2725283 RepID=A0A848KS43_9ACTN|nr:MarR family winged helix-turn-helix transcriptional regulator [Gordonia asplenii]NMO00939.1 winged helix-turn-helix transcriptional regulator [Gordonia asplenii]